MRFDGDFSYAKKQTGLYGGVKPIWVYILCMVLFMEGTSSLLYAQETIPSANDPIEVLNHRIEILVLENRRLRAAQDDQLNSSDNYQNELSDTRLELESLQSRYNKSQSIIEDAEADAEESWNQYNTCIADQNENKIKIEKLQGIVDRNKSCQETLANTSDELLKCAKGNQVKDIQLSNCSQNLIVAQEGLISCKGKISEVQGCNRRMESVFSALGECGQISISENAETKMLTISGTFLNKKERDLTLNLMGAAYPDYRIDRSGIEISNVCKNRPFEGTTFEFDEYGPIMATKYEIPNRSELFLYSECARLGKMVEDKIQDTTDMFWNDFNPFWMRNLGNDLVLCGRGAEVWTILDSPSISTDQYPSFRMANP